LRHDVPGSLRQRRDRARRLGPRCQGAADDRQRPDRLRPGARAGSADHPGEERAGGVPGHHRQRGTTHGGWKDPDDGTDVSVHPGQVGEPGRCQGIPGPCRQPGVAARLLRAGPDLPVDRGNAHRAAVRRQPGQDPCREGAPDRGRRIPRCRRHHHPAARRHPEPDAYRLHPRHEGDDADRVGRQGCPGCPAEDLAGRDRQGQRELMATLTELRRERSVPDAAPPPARRPKLREFHWYVPYLFMAPIMVLFVVFFAWPAVLALQLAFYDYSVINPTVFVGWDNFVRMMSDPRLGHATVNSLKYLVGLLPLTVMFPLLLAVLLNQRLRAIGL